MSLHKGQDLVSCRMHVVCSGRRICLSGERAPHEHCPPDVSGYSFSVGLCLKEPQKGSFESNASENREVPLLSDNDTFPR